MLLLLEHTRWGAGAALQPGLEGGQGTENLVNALGGATFDLFFWSCWCISQVLMLLSRVLEDGAPRHGQGVGLSELQPWGLRLLGHSEGTWCSVFAECSGGCWWPLLLQLNWEVQGQAVP